MNRGGALFVDEMQYESFPERAEARGDAAGDGTSSRCARAPFILLFIGYDGQYYLCCSDWKKEVAVRQRLRHLVHGDHGRQARARRDAAADLQDCNHDPVNRLTEALRDRSSGQVTDDGSVDRLLEELIEQDTTSRTIVAELADFAPTGNGRPARRLIPVISETDARRLALPRRFGPVVGAIDQPNRLVDAYLPRVRRERVRIRRATPGAERILDRSRELDRVPRPR